MAAIKRFEDLECWKKARLLCSQVFKICAETSLRTEFALKDQILRSRGSVMDNIAEGFERGGNKEFIQFLFIAKASCTEVKSQLYRALDRDYISEDDFKEIYGLGEEVSKMLSGLINFLRKTEKTGFKYNPK